MKIDWKMIVVGGSFSIYILAQTLGSMDTGTDEVSLLQSQGYSEIELGGYSFTGCPTFYPFHKSFTAVSANKTKVSGTVCSSPFNGTTINFN